MISKLIPVHSLYEGTNNSWESKALCKCKTTLPQWFSTYDQQTLGGLQTISNRSVKD